MLKRLREASISQESQASSVNKSAMATSPLPQQMPQTTKPVLGQTGRAPSLLGLLAAKRFTRNLKNKYRRTGSLYGSSRHSTSIQVQREPTYRLEPQHKFNPEEVEGVIQSVIDARMKGFKYHPKFCSNMCKALGDEIKENVKKLNYDRYKIVTIVHIGERKDQSTIVASRCAWDKNLDDFACYSLETGNLFCTASVFGIYNE